jgi:hypothetical protein
VARGCGLLLEDQHLLDDVSLPSTDRMA